MNRTAGYLFLFLALVTLSAPARAQDYAPDDDANGYLAEGADDQYDFTDGQIDQLVAPVALYPDPLLANVLMASTYPLHIVAAHRWLQDDGHARLSGDALTDALEDMPWAPSVKALVTFPDVLTLLDDNLSWTEQLGQAFADQEQDVMDSVQRLRRTAFEQGTLTSTPQQQVAWSNNILTIQPVSPQIIYVPVYSPLIVYRAWPWADYPPYVFRYARNVVFYRSRPILFTHGTVVVTRLNFVKHMDWHDRRIIVDRDRYTRITRSRPPVFQHDVWRPDRDFHHDFRFHAQRGRYPEQVNRRAVMTPSAPSTRTFAPQQVSTPVPTSQPWNGRRHEERRREIPQQQPTSTQEERPTRHRYIRQESMQVRPLEQRMERQAPIIQQQPAPIAQPQTQAQTQIQLPQLQAPMREERREPPRLIRQESLQMRPAEQRIERPAPIIQQPQPQAQPAQPAAPVAQRQVQPQVQAPQPQAPAREERRDRGEHNRHENRNDQDNHTNDRGAWHRDRNDRN